VARACSQTGSLCVFISTDYVFGREDDRTVPYLEEDVPAPLNTYGTSKVAGELLVQAACPRSSLIIRSSSLYGCVTSKKGWTFPELMIRKARAGDPLKVVVDQHMAPTYTFDLASRILALVDAVVSFSESNYEREDGWLLLNKEKILGALANKPVLNRSAPEPVGANSTSGPTNQPHTKESSPKARLASGAWTPFLKPHGGSEKKRQHPRTL